MVVKRSPAPFSVLLAISAGVSVILAGAPGFGEVRVRPEERRSGESRLEVGLGDLVADAPGGQRRVPVVIEERAMVRVAPALGGHANIRNAGVFGIEAVRKHGQLANAFERRLAADRLAESRAGGSLPIQGEVGAPALRSDELESVVGIEGDVGR